MITAFRYTANFLYKGQLFDVENDGCPNRIKIPRINNAETPDSPHLGGLYPEMHPASHTSWPWVILSSMVSFPSKGKDKSQHASLETLLSRQGVGNGHYDGFLPGLSSTGL